MFWVFNPATGALSPEQIIPSVPPGFTGTDFTSEIRVSADGDFVYGANRLNDTISVFKLKQSDKIINSNYGLKATLAPLTVSLTVPDGKIGQVQVPEALIARMRASACVRLETDTEARVTLLLQEYEFFLKNQESLYQQLDCLVSLHGRERIAEWKALAARDAWREFVARLLLEHYDPAYRRSSHKNFVRLADARSVRVASADEAAFSRAAQLLLASAELQPA